MSRQHNQRPPLSSRKTMKQPIRSRVFVANLTTSLMTRQHSRFITLSVITSRRSQLQHRKQMKCTVSRVTSSMRRQRRRPKLTNKDHHRASRESSRGKEQRQSLRSLKLMLSIRFNRNLQTSLSQMLLCSLLSSPSQLRTPWKISSSK